MREKARRGREVRLLLQKGSGQRVKEAGAELALLVNSLSPSEDSCAFVFYSIHTSKKFHSCIQLIVQALCL